MMPIEIDPDLVSYGDPDPRSGLAQVYYAGVPVPYLCGFPVRPDEHGAASARRVAVDGIERRLAAMSAHERLRVEAAVRGEDVDWSKAARATFPNLRRSDDAD